MHMSKRRQAGRHRRAFLLLCAAQGALLLGPAKDRQWPEHVYPWALFLLQRTKPSAAEDTRTSAAYSGIHFKYLVEERIFAL